MSVSTDHLWPIDPDREDSALAVLSANAAHAQEAWRLLLAIKSAPGLVGRVFDRRSAEAVQKAVGSGYRVTYSIRDYSPNRPRCILIQRLDEQGQGLPGARWHWDFALATTENPRLTAETLDERMTYYREQAARYLKFAADLPQLVSQYNAACDYMCTVRDELSMVLIYAGQR